MAHPRCVTPPRRPLGNEDCPTACSPSASSIHACLFAPSSPSRLKLGGSRCWARNMSSHAVLFLFNHAVATGNCVSVRSNCPIDEIGRRQHGIRFACRLPPPAPQTVLGLGLNLPRLPSSWPTATLLNSRTSPEIPNPGWMCNHDVLLPELPFDSSKSTMITCLNLRGTSGNNTC